MSDQKNNLSAEFEPHSLDAEKAVLGCLFAVPEKLAEMKDLGMLPLPEEPGAVFFRTLNQSVFAAMWALFQAGVEVDEVMVLERMKADGTDDGLVVTDLFAFTGDVKTAVSLQFYAKIVVSTWKQRVMRRCARMIMEEAGRPGDAFDEVRRAIQPSLTRLGELSVNEVRSDVVSEFDAMVERKRAEFAGEVELVPEEFRVHLGMPENEKKLGFIDRRQTDNMIVIGAPSSRGKSTLMRQAVNVNLLQHGDWNILVFILEGGGMKYLHQMGCNRARIPNRDHHAWLTGEEKQGAERANRAQGRMGTYFKHLAFIREQLNKRLFVFERDRSINDIVARAREMESRLGRIDLVVVDYVQKVEGSRPGANREQEVSEVSGRLQGLQVSLGCPLITGSQLNEDGKARESRAVFNDATRFLVIDRPAKTPNGVDQSALGLKQYFQTLAQTKERDGATGIVGYNFNTECGVFMDFHGIPDEMRGRPKKPKVAEGKEF